MFVSERGEIHVELESDVERRVRGRKWERKMSAGIDMSSGRRARCLSHPRFFAAHGMGMVFSSGEEEMGSGKRYKEEHIWSSKIDSFNNSIHHNTPHTHSHHTHTHTTSPTCSSLLSSLFSPRSPRLAAPSLVTRLCEWLDGATSCHPTFPLPFQSPRHRGSRYFSWKLLPLAHWS
jgi:hypothetical protein